MLEVIIKLGCVCLIAICISDMRIHKFFYHHYTFVNVCKYFTAIGVLCLTEDPHSPGDSPKSDTCLSMFSFAVNRGHLLVFVFLLF